MSLIPGWVKLLILAAIAAVVIGAFAAYRASLIGMGEERERAVWLERDRVALEASVKETQRRLERQGDSNRETATKLASAAAAVRRERDSSGQLRDELAAADTARRADPAAAAQCAPAEAAVDLRDRLFRGADDTAGELAQYAQAARIAGEQCQELYDSLNAERSTGAKGAPK